MWCRKRRLWCLERARPRKTFLHANGELPPRARVTRRLGEKLADCIARCNRAVSDVAPADQGAGDR